MVSKQLGSDQCARGQGISVIMKVLSVYARFTLVSKTGEGGGEQRGSEEWNRW